MGVAVVRHLCRHSRGTGSILVMFAAVLTLCSVVSALSIASLKHPFAPDAELQEPLAVEKPEIPPFEPSRSRYVPASFDHPRPIYGRFLHVTDFHPDPYYKRGTSAGEECHSGKGPAGKYGYPVEDCDSPFTLVDATIRWIHENLADSIDFIVWTGDNVRHDNDRRYPRTELRIFDLNEIMANRFVDQFRIDDPYMFELEFPIIPTIGNNDVYPHNVIAEGPTLQTREFYRIWRHFVPEEQFHAFQRGINFFDVIIPDKLAVISLNTLYLFKANPLVDNCDSRKSPGYKLFEWLGTTLDYMRKRGMKVWLIGHVVPLTMTYDYSCVRKFAVWEHEYRDVIIGSLYGHQNTDYFAPLDAVKAYRSLVKQLELQGDAEAAVALREYMYTEFTGHEEIEAMQRGEDLKSVFEEYEEELQRMRRIQEAQATDKSVKITKIPGKVTYMNNIREQYYAKMKFRRNDTLGERYAISNVGSSILPTYWPGMRVYEYNTTGLEGLKVTKRQDSTTGRWDKYLVDSTGSVVAESTHQFWAAFAEEVENLYVEAHANDDDEEGETAESQKLNVRMLAGILKGQKPFKEDRSWPTIMPKGTPLGPAYVAQTLTPIKYTQYNCNLTEFNNKERPFAYDVEYVSDAPPYNLADLTTPSYIEFAKRLSLPLKLEKKLRELGVGVEDPSDESVELSGQLSAEELAALELTEEERQFVMLLDESNIDNVELGPLELDTIEKLKKLWKVFMNRVFIGSGFEAGFV